MHLLQLALLITLMTIGLHSIALADMSANDAFNEGNGFGVARNAEVRDGVSTSAAEDTVSNYSSTSERSALYGGMTNLAPFGTNEKVYCQTEGLSAPDSRQREACNATNMLSNLREHAPEIIINRETDPLMIRKREVLADPVAATGMPFATSLSECSADAVTSSDITRTETCFDGIPLPSSASCQMPWEVEVVQHNRYACLTGKDGCDAGGLVPASWAGDMAVNWSPLGSGNYRLQFGTIGDNYWPGSGTIYDRTLTFSVSNVSNITLMKLTRARFDDWLLVQLNGHVVYFGPFGGDRLEIIDSRFGARVQYSATAFGWAELSTDWNFNLNIDLRPYLREGTNVLFTRTIVSGRGESAIQITTRQKCPSDCTVSWNKTACAPYH